MPNRFLIPNPSLVAILLVTRDSAGGNLVFHYPPHPRATDAQNTSSWRVGETNTDFTSSDSSFSSSSDSDDDGGDRKSRSTVRRYGAAATATERSAIMSQRSHSYDQRSSKRRSSGHDYDDDDDEDDNDTGDPSGAEWEHVLGFKQNVLASLLSVPRALSKARFELAVDNLVFLGFPYHCKPDGTWQRRKKERKPRSESTVKVGAIPQGISSEPEDDEDTTGHDADTEDAGTTNRNTSTASSHEQTKSKKDSRNTGEQKASKLAMFHVVFVMNPPHLEHHSRTNDMYDVAREFSIALKSQQADDDYVAREAERIVEIRERGDKRGDSINDLWAKILRESQLATAIATLYQGISTSKIAHIKLNDFGFALHIPILLETPVLPSMSEPQLPGMHLTTLRGLGPTPSEAEDPLMTRHYTLLFLEDTEEIIKEIILDQNPGEKPSSLSTSFIQFIRTCKPTVSFAQMLTSSVTHTPEENKEYQYIQYFARHLIYWRKARCIMPLHHRRYYIVSPNADMKKLASHSVLFSKSFPMLPPLPKMLSLLSGKPRPYYMYIPSKDHRQAYIDMLAWLMRYGWVTGLLTFAYLKIPKDVKLAVKEKQRRKAAEAAVEAIQAANVTAAAANNASPDHAGSPGNSQSVETATASSNTSQIPRLEIPESNLSKSLGQSQASSLSSSRPKSAYSDLTDTSSTLLKGSLGPASSGNPTSAFDNPDSSRTDGQPGESSMEDSIVYEPSRASQQESTWIDELTEGLSPDIVALFDRLVMYLNGKHAIEGIALRESISKRDLKRVLAAMDRYIIYVRHW